MVHPACWEPMLFGAMISFLFRTMLTHEHTSSSPPHCHSPSPRLTDLRIVDPAVCQNLHRPHLIGRVARHYEHASQVLVAQCVSTAPVMSVDEAVRAASLAPLPFLVQDSGHGLAKSSPGSVVPPMVWVEATGACICVGYCFFLLLLLLFSFLLDCIFTQCFPLPRVPSASARPPICYYYS